MQLSSWFLLKPKTYFGRHLICFFLSMTKLFFWVMSCKYPNILYWRTSPSYYDSEESLHEKISHCNLFIFLHEAFWHKSCIMFTLIIFGVTCSFVDPSQSTVLTPLTSTSKCQNNIGTHRSHFIFQDFSYAIMVTIESWRTGSSFASCCYERYWTCHAPPYVWQ
jgi:hypothetical protein